MIPAVASGVLRLRTTASAKESLLQWLLSKVPVSCSLKSCATLALHSQAALRRCLVLLSA